MPSRCQSYESPTSQADSPARLKSLFHEGLIAVLSQWARAIPYSEMRENEKYYSLSITERDYQLCDSSLLTR